jgi:hypothetical protein
VFLRSAQTGLNYEHAMQFSQSISSVKMEWISSVLETLSSSSRTNDEDSHSSKNIGSPFHLDTFDWPRGLHCISSP